VSFLLPARYSSRFSAGTRDQSCCASYVSIYTSRDHQFNAISLIVTIRPSRFFFLSPRFTFSKSPSRTPTWRIPKDKKTHLIQVDNRLPEVVSLLVEIPHSDLSKVTGMVLVHVCSVVMLATSQTSTTGMLAMLSYTTVAGGDVTAAVFMSVSIYYSPSSFIALSNLIFLRALSLLCENIRSSSTCRAKPLHSSP